MTQSNLQHSFFDAGRIVLSLLNFLRGGQLKMDLCREFQCCDFGFNHWLTSKDTGP